MMKVVNGVHVPLTEDEIAAREAEEADWVAAAPLREKAGLIAQLHATDVELARVVEDIYDVLTAEQKAALPQAAKDKFENRKALRAQL